VQLAPAAISSVDIRQATTAVGKWADTCTQPPSIRTTRPRSSGRPSTSFRGA